MEESPTLRDLLGRLSAEGYSLPSDYEKIPISFDSEKTDSASPWYLRIFVGLIAWIAAVLFIAFLAITGVIQFDLSALVVGLLICAIAVVLNRTGTHGDFIAQLALSLSLAGQLAVINGLNGVTHYHVLSTAIGMLILELILIWLFHSRVHRLISTLAGLGAILVIINELKFLLLIHIMIFTLGLGVLLLLQSEYKLLISGHEELIRPILYGCTVFFLGLCVLPLFKEFRLHWWISALLLVGLLVFILTRIVFDLGLSLRSGVIPWLAIGCIVLFVPAMRMPGILGAMIILVLGFWRNERLMIGLSLIAFVYYLGAYYYSLDWTLLVKSYALFGTGIILLLLRFILLRYARGGAS